jgi:ankyrin repeat protein
MDSLNRQGSGCAMLIQPIRVVRGGRLRIQLLTAGALAIGLVATVHSAVYKCASKDGSTAYSDVPCDQDAQVVNVTPDPLHSKLANPQPRAPGAPTGQPRNVAPAINAAGQDKSARETSAGLCTTKAFNEWIKAQGLPLPDPNVRVAKMIEIGNQCRRPLGLSDMIPPAPIPGPKPILGGAPGAAAATNLAQLVQSGSVERLQEYLATPGVDIDDRPGTDEALLDYAAEQRQTAIAQFLIEHGAKVNAVQHQGANAGYSALHRAAVADAADVAELLLAHGAEVNIHGPLGVTPLILAASNGSRPTAEVLLKHGADVLTPDGHGQTALSLASARMDTDLVKQLLVHLPTPTSTSMNNAAMRGDLEALRLMIRHDELVHDMSAAMKDEALRFTILGGPNPLPARKQMIELLLASGADIDNHPPQLNVIPVMLAPSAEMAEFLFAHGANQKARLSGALLAQWIVCNNSGKDPLGSLQVVVAHGIDIGGSASSGQSALPCAERANNSELIAFLREHQVGVARPGDHTPMPTPGAAMNAALEAQLHPKRPCVRLDEIKDSPTPMELYGALKDCLQTDRDADAVALFALAGMDSTLDAMRVTDKTAGQARQILIMDLFQGMSADVHTRFESAMKDESAHPQRHAVLCEQVKKIGPPRYFPTYMVNHGMGAVQSALTNRAQPAPLEPNFNAAGAWTTLLANYLNCSAPVQLAELTPDGWPIPPAKHLPTVKALPPRDRIILEVRNKNKVDVPNEIGIFDLTTHTESRWDVLETALREPPATQFGAQADWAPRAGKLLYGTQRSLHLVSTDGTDAELHPIMPGKLKPMDGMTAYTVSADGQRFAYMLYTRDSGDRQPDGFGKLYTDIMVQRAAGSPPISVWNDGSTVIRPAWRPDGAAIAHTDSNNNIVVSDLAGKTLWSFHPGPPSSGAGIADYIDEIHWDPSGKRLAFLMGSPIAEIYTVNADGTGSRRVEFRNPADSGRELSIRAFAWSPDGTQFAIRAEADSKCNNAALGYKIQTGNFPCIYSRNLFTGNVDGSHLNKVTPVPDYEFGELFWIQ